VHRLWGQSTDRDGLHLIPRWLGGRGDALCVTALYSRCRRAFDRGELDLLPSLEPARRAQLAHAVAHVGLVGGRSAVGGCRRRDRRIVSDADSRSWAGGGLEDMPTRCADHDTTPRTSCKRRRRVDLRLSLRADSRFPCPQRGRPCQPVEFTEPSWRQPDVMAADAFVTTRPPSIRCPEHGEVALTPSRATDHGSLRALIRDGNTDQLDDTSAQPSARHPRPPGRSGRARRRARR
jgi:hypothetical protein